MPDQLLYIIHSAEDRNLARYLKSEFENVVPGLKAFLASKAGDIPTGSDWLAEVQQNLRAGTTYFALLTPRSLERYWVWYEVGAAWATGRRYLPVAAAGLDRNKIPYPLGAKQTLSLDDPDDAQQLFRDLGGQLEKPEEFCVVVRALALPPPNSEPTAERQREVQQAFGELGGPPKFILKRMLTVGGMTLSDMASDLDRQRFVSDMTSVERILRALKDRHLVEGDFEGRWRVKSELSALVQQCLQPAPLSERLLQLARELEEWVGDADGPLDCNGFEKHFRTRLKLLAEKAAADYGEGHPRLLDTVPSSVDALELKIDALVDLAKRVP